ncbi:MAG: sterol desaturase family protein [Planctomycetaceae bacterium]
MTIAERLQRSLEAIPKVSIADAIWYVLFAGVTYLVFHGLLRTVLRHRRISDKPNPFAQIQREVWASAQSLAIFGLVGGCVKFASLSGWTQFYFRIEDRGWAWYGVSFLLMIAMHDTYFYWTHRLMHHRRLFKLFHLTHHRSTSPTPWAAYAFSPLEAIVQAGIGPLIAFTIPVHPSAFLPFMIWQITFNVLGHCGYEIWPSWFLETRLGRFLNTPTHHSLHHEKFKSNYGLYFNFWDYVMSTNHATYEQRFARATTVPQPEPLPVLLAFGPIERPAPATRSVAGERASENQALAS